MSWNYRIVRHPVSKNKPHEEEYYALHEVHYDDDGDVTGISDKPVSFVGEEGLDIVQNLKRALDSCLKESILDNPWPDDVYNDEGVVPITKSPWYKVTFDLISRTLHHTAITNGLRRDLSTSIWKER